MYFLKVLLKEREQNFVTNLHNMVFRCILRMSLITKAYIHKIYSFSLPSKNLSKLEFALCILYYHCLQYMYVVLTVGCKGLVLRISKYHSIGLLECFCHTYFPFSAFLLMLFTSNKRFIALS